MARELNAGKSHPKLAWNEQKHSNVFAEVGLVVSVPAEMREKRKAVF